MSKNLERKLLAEAFDAIVNDNDMARATRLFKRHWDLTAKSQYALLESEDSDFDITDMGEDLNSEIAADAGSDEDERFEQLGNAIDELESKYRGENSDEIMSKLDELRNIADEMKMDDGEGEVSVDDALVTLEDLRGDFEAAESMDDEVSDLFDEIESRFKGDEGVEDDSDVADDDSEMADEKPTEEPVDEADENMPDVQFDEDEVPSEEPMKDENADEKPVEDEADDKDEEDDVEELALDVKDDIDALLAELDIDSDDDDKVSVEEGWSNIAEPRKKMTSEVEGINKKGTMNFGKLRGMTLDKSAGLGTSNTDSKGISADKKAKVCPTENKGAKQWHKTEKPANKPTSSKSMMGN